MSRSNEYRQAVEALQNELDFERFYEIFRARLMDSYRKMPDQAELFKYQTFVRNLFGPQFVNLLVQVDQDYSKVLEMVNKFYSEIGIDISRDFQTIQALEKVNSIRFGNYEEFTVDAIAREFRKSRFKNESVDEFAVRLQTKIDGLAVSYANTLARTFVKSHGQAMKNEKAAIGEVNYFTYVGPPVIETGPSESHVFCKSTYHQGGHRTYHVKDIKHFRNGQLEPVKIHRGGYRCRHDWEPNPEFNAKDYAIEIVTVMSFNKEVKFGRPK